MVEDVDYLKETGVETEYVTLIDSDERDKKAYPYPQHYQIQFSAPFKLVYSVSVIDASIPRTSYSVDVHNNVFRFRMRGLNYNNTEAGITAINAYQWRTITLDPGDYNEVTFKEAFNNKMIELGVSIRLESSSSPPELLSTFRMQSDEYFEVDMHTSTLNNTMGFDTYNNRASTADHIDDWLPNRIKFSNAEQVVFQYRDPPFSDLGPIYYTATTNEYYVDNSFVLQAGTSPLIGTGFKAFVNNDASVRRSIVLVEGGLGTLWYLYDDGSIEDKPIGTLLNSINFTPLYGSFDVNYPYPTDTYFNTLVENELERELYFCRWFGSQSIDESFEIDALFLADRTAEYTLDTGTNPSRLIQEIYLTDSTYASGFLQEVIIPLSDNSVARTFSWYLYQDSALTILLADSNTDLTTVDIPLIADAASPYWLVVDSGRDDNGAAADLIFDVHTEYAVGAIVVGNDPVLNPAPTNNESIVVNIKLKKYYTIIESPDQYNLLGDKYINLRCPEVESHMNLSKAHEKFTMGLAMFQLSVAGLNDVRFDYHSVRPRVFHPMGELRTLTFSFERPSGVLYDFRGINHVMTIAIRYYTPKKLGKIDTYPLNLKYDPDMFRYMQEHGYNTSDDDEEELNLSPRSKDSQIN